MSAMLTVGQLTNVNSGTLYFIQSTLLTKVRVVFIAEWCLTTQAPLVCVGLFQPRVPRTANTFTHTNIVFANRVELHLFLTIHATGGIRTHGVHNNPPAI